MKTETMVGKVYSRLTVVSFDRQDIKSHKYWRCQCICGNETVVREDRLKNQTTKSCGCLRKGNKSIRKISNEYEVNSDEVIVHFHNSDLLMLCDYDDLNFVKQYTWTLQSSGYATTRINGKIRTFHKAILDAPDGKVIDHINGNKLDNRKKNLRIVSMKENAINRKIMKNNTTGITGVGVRNGKYIAYIGVDKKFVFLGAYLNIEDAARARKNAEQKYFGEYAREK